MTYPHEPGNPPDPRYAPTGYHYSDPRGYPTGYPPQRPNRTPQILAGVAAVIALAAAAALIGVWIARDGDGPDDDAQPSGVVTVTTHQQAPGQGPTAETTIIEPPTVTTTTTVPTGAVSVVGADGRGFTSGPRCNAAEDPAIFIGETSRSRVVICQVGSQVGRNYYKGYADGQTIEVGYPTRSGSTFTAINGSTSYIVSPSALVIRDGGSVAANEPMIQSWVR